MGRTVTRSKSKPAGSKAKPKASSNGKARVTAADLDAKVDSFVKHLKGGGTMNDLVKKAGVSGAQPIREALRRNGYDTKGNKNAIEKINLTGAKLRDKVISLRESGEAWGTLAIATGKSESELKDLIKEKAPHLVAGRTYRPAAPKPKASGSKSGAKKSGGSGSGSKRVVRRGKAGAKDPS